MGSRDRGTPLVDERLVYAGSLVGMIKSYQGDELWIAMRCWKTANRDPEGQFIPGQIIIKLYYLETG